MRTSTALAQLLLSPTFSWAGITYSVEEIDLGGGYKIAGGTITTDMPPTMITAFSIEVTGPVPYTFSSSSANPSEQSPHSFTLTPSSITVDLDGTTSEAPGFINDDDSHANCGTNACSQTFSWNRLAQDIFYEHIDVNDFDPGVQHNSALSGVVTVATAIPEPGGFLCLGLIGVSIALRKEMLWKRSTTLQTCLRCQRLAVTSFRDSVARRRLLPPSATL